jgi:hypothetical protein
MTSYQCSELQNWTYVCSKWWKEWTNTWRHFGVASSKRSLTIAILGDLGFSLSLDSLESYSAITNHLQNFH